MLLHEFVNLLAGHFQISSNYPHELAIGSFLNQHFLFLTFWQSVEPVGRHLAFGFDAGSTFFV